MTDKPRKYKYFSPPRWSVFATEMPAEDNVLQQSGRKRRYFPDIPERSCETSSISLSGIANADSTFSVENQKSLQNVTFEISTASKNKEVSISTAATEFSIQNSSIMGEDELESTFCLPEGDATFNITANDDKRRNLCASRRQSMKTHAMLTRTGKPVLEEPHTVEKDVLESRPNVVTEKSIKLASLYENNIAKMKSNAPFSQRSLNTPTNAPSNASCKSSQALRRSMRIKCEENVPSLSASSPCNSQQRARRSASRRTRLNDTKSQLGESVLPLSGSPKRFGLVDLPAMNCFTPSASSSPTKKRTSVGLDDTFTLTSSQLVADEKVPAIKKEVLISASKGTRRKRFFSSPSSPASVVNSTVSGGPESSLMLATCQSTFELPSQGSKVFIKQEKDAWPTVADNVSEMPSTVVESSEMSAVRRSTRNKGKAETSGKLKDCDVTSDLPSLTNGLIKTEINEQLNAAISSADLPSNHSRIGDNKLGEKRNVTFQLETASPTLCTFQSSQNILPRVQKTAKRRTRMNMTNSTLHSSDSTFTNRSHMVSSGMSELSISCVPELTGNNLTASISCNTENTSGKHSNLTVPAVVIASKEDPADVSLTTYFSRTVTVTDKENMPENKANLAKEEKPQIPKGFKSRIPVPTKKRVCKETFVSKIPVSFKFRKADAPESGLRTATTKQWSADKVTPFQFSAKPVALASKPTVQARAFAYHREKAAVERRLTARCIASKSAPKDRNGKAVSRQKLYHEMVRTNRTHELMLRRRV